MEELEPEESSQDEDDNLDLVVEQPVKYINETVSKIFEYSNYILCVILFIFLFYVTYKKTRAFLLTLRKEEQDEIDKMNKRGG